MSSPFTRFANTQITFFVSDGTFKINSVGNRIANTVPLEIKAMLKESTNKGLISRYSQEIQQFAGADSLVFLLEGYLVEPAVYPQKLKFMTEGNATFRGVLNKPQIGTFKLLPVVQSPYLVAAKINIVTPLVGLFR